MLNAHSPALANYWDGGHCLHELGRIEETTLCWEGWVGGGGGRTDCCLGLEGLLLASGAAGDWVVVAVVGVEFFAKVGSGCSAYPGARAI